MNIDSTAVVSAGAAKGAVSFQNVPSLTRAMLSPPLTATFSSLALALSTVSSVTFVLSVSGFGSCLRSTNQ